jgi:probable F420-dependent oxidoreductase
MNPRPFRFGAINEQLLAPQQWLDHVRQIEALGYDTLLIRDHLLPNYFGEQYAPLIALATAAAHTSRLGLGTMVLANDFRHPALLAKEAATLHAFSGGRFELGIGAGWLRAEYAAMGLNLDAAGRRIARLEEAVTALKAFWSGESVTLAGRHYQLQELAITPLTTPPPRLFLGGGHERMLSMAGRLADSVGLLTSSVASGELVADPAERSPEAVERKLGWVRAGAGARFDAIELSLMPTVVLAADRLAATERLIAEQGWQGVAPEAVWAMPSFFVGDIAQIAQAMLERRARYGFSYYVFSDRQAAELAPLVARLRGV